MVKRQLSIHNVRGTEGAVVSVSNEVLAREKTVYFHIVNKPLKYPYGRSRIVYIGTTKKGIRRIMGSIAERLEDEFNIHGVSAVEVHEIGCTPRQRVKTWRMLERAALNHVSTDVRRSALAQQPRGTNERVGRIRVFQQRPDQEVHQSLGIMMSPRIEIIE